MSALARYFIFKGKDVYGYDKVNTNLTQKLESEGASITYLEEIETLVKEVDLVIYTPAIPDSHVHLSYYRDNAYDVLKRSEVLELISAAYKTIAIAGTHGKTTITSMAAHIAQVANLNPSAFVGGLCKNFNGNLVLGHGPYLFVFVENTLSEGHVILKRGLQIEGAYPLSYYLDDKEAFAFAENIAVKDSSYHFDLIVGQEKISAIQLKMQGIHNVENAVAAAVINYQLGVDLPTIKKALESFEGIKRRFEFIHNSEDFVFIDDYAHHPTEINAVYDAISEMHPNKKALAIFQPHLFSRTKDFADDFAKSLSKFDAVILLDIYPARELPIEGITSEWLLEKIENPKKKLVQKSELIDEIMTQKPELLVTMGAGDIGLEVSKIKRELEYAN